LPEHLEYYSYPIDEVLSTEVLVIGSGVAGICAAIQAARLGCDVTLVEKDDVLGGNGGPGLGVHVSGAHSFHPYAGETGVVAELKEKAAYFYAKTYTWGHHYNISRQWESLLANELRKAGVRVLKRHLAKHPIVEADRIQAVMVEDLATYKTKRIDIGLFVVEASGDGHVAARAGADYRMGREARSEFGERSAPEEADALTLGTSVTALVRKASHPVPFVPPEGTPLFEPGYGFAGKLGQCLYGHSSWHPNGEFCFLWHTETGGHLNTIEDDHIIYEMLLKQLYSAWQHIKTAHAEEAANWELVWVSPKAGKRESRRFLGDVIVTQQDVEEARLFSDRVGYGGYSVDIHNPVGEQSEVVFYSIPPLYSIPYRALYSRNVNNLFLTGRLASYTHLALGTTRLQATLGTTGQAVGAAAALCKRLNCTPRQLYERHLDQLQQLLLREDATILELPNGDLADLARSAQVTATSEELYECARLADFLPLDTMRRGVILMDWGPELREVQLFLRNETDADLPVELELGFWGRATRWKPNVPYRGKPHPDHAGRRRNRAEWDEDKTLANCRPVATAKTVLPPRFTGWAVFPFSSELRLAPKDPTCDSERYCLSIGPTPGLSWARDALNYDFVRRCAASPHETEYDVYTDAHLLRVTPRPPYGDARNIINGYNRRFATNPVNMWISNRDEPLPQAVELELAAEECVREVRVTFDTLYRGYREMPLDDPDRRVAGMCVRDYLIEAQRADGSWVTLVTERGNYRRHRVHRVSPTATRRIRLVVQATNEPGYPARVYEVRIYGE
jgi:hypothetical protein